MTRVAAIDCGTNSVRLLIADISGERLTDVERRMEIVRLGQDVDRTGRLAPEALERTFAAMRGYAKLIREHAVPGDEPARTPVGMPVRVVATSATRDAANRADFVSGVREIFGVEPEVVTGAEEAGLSFTGATRGLAAEGAGEAAEGPYLVVDIGGGSTEFVVGTVAGTAEGVVTGAMSVDIGCVRLTERHLTSAGDPPSREAVQAAITDIEAAMDRVEAAVPVRNARTLVGLAGSVTTVAGIALGLPAYDPARIHHSRIPAERVHEVSGRLLRMTHEERAAIPVMHPGRVDVIGAGALILGRIVGRYGFREVVVSEHDILDGIAWSLV
ncbi:Ppx/GppA phosphatase family protein [Sphaerimonospora thailandensis]|uniref:Hydrolase n=1 Tax=Sphaerimonospora thailandensis TaxID=795644 RepID=A0A8J3RC49_9ACTN|nr:Ppx/GppA phosphatase family protein [Sphaerimonospora thailandensis]GIH71895.1 hydrolase [Sphaerimonospora thailandensis]